MLEKVYNMEKDYRIIKIKHSRKADRQTKKIIQNTTSFYNKKGTVNSMSTSTSVKRTQPRYNTIVIEHNRNTMGDNRNLAIYLDLTK